MGSSLNDATKKISGGGYYANVSVPGPTDIGQQLVGYDASKVNLTIEYGDPNLPFGRYDWQIQALSILGANPV